MQGFIRAPRKFEQWIIEMGKEMYLAEKATAENAKEQGESPATTEKDEQSQSQSKSAKESLTILQTSVLESLKT